MEELYDYIEAYFAQTLSEAEREAFEMRCVTDETFANEVALYVASRQAIRQQLLQQKQQQWSAATAEAPARAVVKPIRSLLQRWQTYAAAACTIIATATYFIISSPSAQQMATAYVQHKYARLDVNMGTPDTLQEAITAYNAKNYTKALKLFEMLQISHPGNADEKKYAGLVYLFTGDYDKAIQQFDTLAKMPGLFSNPGNFLKAAALIERGNPGDNDQAKMLLRQVVKDNTEGAETAAKWLEKL